MVSEWFIIKTRNNSFLECLGYYLLFHDNAHPQSANQAGRPLRHLALFYFYLSFKNGEYVVRNECFNESGESKVNMYH